MPNWPASAGRANTARLAEPPLRFRSWPQPTRSIAGRIVPYISANCSMSTASSPQTSAAPLDRPLPAGGEVLVGAVDPVLHERTIDVAVALQQRGDRHRQHAIGAWTHREVQVGAGGDRRAPRIDDHQLRAGSPAILDHRRQVRMRHVGIGAPHHDQLAVLQVRRVSRRHGAVRAIPRLADHRRADRDVGSCRAEVLPHQR